MAVDRASYRPWEGSARPTPLVAIAIAHTMARRLMKLRLVRWMVKVVIVCAAAISALIMGMNSMFNEGPLAGMLRRGPVDLDPLVIGNRFFAPKLLGFAVLLAAIVGAPLIAEDRKSRALPLYFSRPISHRDYVLGKLFTLVFFLGLMILGPPLVMYLIDVAFAQADGAWWDKLPVLGRSLASGLVACAVLGALALGVSSLTEKPNHAALLFLGVVFFSGVVASIMSLQMADRDPAWLAVSPVNCLRRISNHMMPMPQLPQRPDPVDAIPIGSAWIGAGIWAAIGVGLLVVRIRKVEVVA